MGVPALFRWLSNKYPKIISPVIEEQAQKVDGEEIPLDITGPNPNGEEQDNLYLDMNGIVHPCTHPEGRPPPADEQEMMLEIYKYTDRVVNMVRPRKLLMIAIGINVRVDSAQRKRPKRTTKRRRSFTRCLLSNIMQRRARSTFERKLFKRRGIAMLSRQEHLSWTSLQPPCAIGSPTSSTLTLDGRTYLKIIISDATVPGEGEHKIMNFVRSQRASPDHDPNTRHVIYGLDADLIMLGLGTHEPYFRVLREDVFAQDSRPRGCKLCGQNGHKAEECLGRPKEKSGEFDEKQNAAPLKPFIWLHVAVLREYLAVELRVPQQPFPFDLERALDDWVFMCFFVGNDFLPHLPSLDIRENGIDTLIAIWRDNLPAMGSYLTKDGSVELKNAQIILQGLAKQEDAIFRRRRQAEERKQANEKRRKEQDEARNAERSQKRRRSSPQYDAKAGGRSGGPPEAVPPMELITPGRGHLAKETRELTHDMVTNRGAVYRANMENKSAAAVLKSKLMKGKQNEPEPSEPSTEDASGEATAHTSLGKRKADAADQEDGEAGTPGRDSPPPPPAEKPKSDEPPEDTVKLWEPGYADRYYEQKFNVDPKNHEFRHQVARDYALGLCWVLRYYFQGCPSWSWYYPHHYAPFAADFVDIADMPVEFEKGAPFRPFEQLMGVLPASSNHALPKVFHPLMEDANSPIIDFYPEDFPLDLNGKKFAWQGVILLPFIDANRLLEAMGTVYPLLTEEESGRNTHGSEVLLLSDRNPLYQDLVANFYSKKPGPAQYSIKQDLSAGLAGIVERSDTYIPHSSLVSPLESHGMPGVDDDRSLTVLYTLPKSSHVHKSMLLRGVKLPTPMLDSSDIRATKGRAQNSGRSFGGAPFQGRGRGGRMNYQSDRPQGDRPNPFAGHLDPNFAPGPPGGPAGAHMVPPGWVPPGQGYGGYSRGPPPPPRGGMGNQYPPQQGYQQNGGYYNPQNQYNQGGQYNNGYQQGGYGSQDYRGGRGGGGYRGGRGRGNYQNQGGGGYGRY
ncbi:unnamed protein product [Penicillium olsonii]|uniref:5'-3' exoribonuclease n=1 Tax=Penicillium olsonii TaxID=99116 RepID=A0A9W4HFY1_PENOL|nr:unnamed protein product [Penicillium olsonii]CAG8038790.1 unnamed protein product [Penicillium olsonii]